MKKNIFEEAYKGIQEAKKAYAEAKDEAEKNAAREHYNKATESLTGLKGIELSLWKAYEHSMDCGNEYIDINDALSNEEAESLITCMKEYGFKAFTFSSSWSSAVEIAWLFQKAGCSLAGLIEINSQYKDLMSDEYEKAHGYLFKVN